MDLQERHRYDRLGLGWATVSVSVSRKNGRTESSLVPIYPSCKEAQSRAAGVMWNGEWVGLDSLF